MSMAIALVIAGADIGCQEEVMPDGYTGMVSSCVRITHTEGVHGLWKGVGAMVMGFIPRTGIRFTTFELVRTATMHDGDKMIGYHTFVFGLIAGSTEPILVATPFDMLKTRMQEDGQLGSQRRYRNTLHALSTITRTEGFSALYRGMGPAWIRQATNQGTRFLIYDKTMELLMSGVVGRLFLGGEAQANGGGSGGRGEGGGRKMWWHSVVAGATAAAGSVMVNHWADTLRTRMQSYGASQALMQQQQQQQQHM